ncbi:MAG TPA: tetratricopeptide repeat protein [Rubrivivax sp.]|nr:tetratricopeptide repeat protein [Burkholderiales bacterium]HNU10399.1 tetratricopeptide repeat protein [Rubrivivax sp.]
MATSLDLQEQEQIDALKAFWKQYGNLITWVLILALGAFAAWNGWNWWQREQAAKAGAMYEELDRAVLAGDAQKVARVFADLKERYPGTAFAWQGALTAARLQLEKGDVDGARTALAWVAEHAGDEESRTLGRLRLAAVLLQARQYDQALAELDQAKAPSFEALVADRRGDVLQAAGKREEARAAYERAYAAMDDKLDYRKLVEAKLISLGGNPSGGAVAAAAAAAASR